MSSRLKAVKGEDKRNRRTESDEKWKVTENRETAKISD